MNKGLTALAAAGMAGLASATAAFALGQPEPWQMGFQEAASPVMERFDSLHNMLLIIITAISAFVLLLLAYVMVRFNAKSNPVPSKTSHNTLLEVTWTVIPIIILVVIAVPSFKLLYYTDRVAEAEMTIKAIGHQWYWSYEYPDYDDLTFDAVMLEDDELKPGQLRLLETDNRVVVPIQTTIRVLVTADDVVHSWSVPAFGVKTDAVPGRVNETWIRVEREGVYYGQCSELCGVGHAFMPIAVEAVSRHNFAAWIEKARQEFAGSSSSAAPRIADAGAGLAD